MEPDSPLILIVEDHRPTRKFLADNLAVDGYELLEAETGAEAQRLMETRFPDLALIDLGLADLDGLDLIRRVRESDRIAGRIDPELPILVLSGRSGDLDRLRGFDRGADDYVTKPFNYTELRARIGALLRRSQRRAGGRRLRIGDLEIDTVGREVRLNGHPVHLSKKEFGLLRALAADPTRVFTREELLRGVWGFRVLGSTRTLDSHASRLRKKLSVHGDRLVVNVWGVGYRLIDGGIE
jgi:DNA-binding response OmpR family regulator